MGLDYLSRDEDDPRTEQTVAEAGGTLEMAGDLTREELAAHLAAADARTDTKFERLLGEMRAGFAQIDGRFAEMEAKMDVRFVDLEARIDRRFITFKSDIDVRLAEFEGSVNARFAETNAKIEAMPSAAHLWAIIGTAAGLALAMVGVIFTSVQWLDARRAEQAALPHAPAVHGPALHGPAQP